MFSDLLTEAQKSAIADVMIASSELEAEVERCIIEFCRLWWPHGSGGHAYLAILDVRPHSGPLIGDRYGVV